MAKPKSGDTVAKLQARLADLTARNCKALVVDTPHGVMLFMGCPSTSACKTCREARRRQPKTPAPTPRPVVPDGLTLVDDEIVLDVTEHPTTDDLHVVVALTLRPAPSARRAPETHTKAR